MNSPGSIAKLTSSTAVTAPKLLRTFSSTTAAPEASGRSVAPETSEFGEVRPLVMGRHALSPRQTPMAMQGLPRYCGPHRLDGRGTEAIMSGTLIEQKAPTRMRLSRPTLVLPLLAYLTAFYAYPVAAMMLRSVTEPNWTLQNFQRAIENPVYLHVLWLTFRVGVIVTMWALLLGFPVAYLLARIDRTKSNLLMMLVLLPFWTSILVRTYAWMVLLGRQGLVNQLLLAIGAIEEPVQLLNTSFAVYVAMVHILLPFMILPLYSVIRGIDVTLLS